MKKTLKMCVNIVALMAVLSLSVAGCTSSGGSSSSGGGTAATTEAGAVAKGYVEGATVIADKIPSGDDIGNLQLDDGEASDVTDGFGDYSVEVPADYGDYLLVSLGGTLIDSGEPAPSMMAPKDADNITPVTTLVALNPDLKAKIGADKYDDDIASPSGVDGAVMALAMTAKAVLDCFGENVNLTDSQQISVLTAMADAFDDAEDLTDADDIAAATVVAVKAAVASINSDDVEFDSDDTATAIGAAVSEIVGGIDMNSTVIESEILESVDAAIDEAADSIDTAIRVVKISLASLVLQNSDGDEQGSITAAEASLTLDEAAAYDSERLVFTLTGRNDFDQIKTYSEEVQLIVELKDADSLRKAKAVISGVRVSVAVADTVTINLSTSAAVRITGTDSTGSAVDVTLTNTSDSGTIVTASSNVLTVNMDVLGTRIESETEAEALYEIGLPGEYTVAMKALNLPLIPTGKIITVE